MNKYDYEVKKALKLSEKEMYELSHPYVGSEHFILAILSFDNEINKSLKKYEIDYKDYKNSLVNSLGKTKSRNSLIIYTPLLKRVIDSENYEFKNKVTLKDTFLCLLDEGEGIGLTILKRLGCDLDSLYKELSKKEVIEKNSLLLELGINLNEQYKNNSLDRVVGRDKEIRRLIEILARKNKNNPILLGEAGVGKTAIVEGLVARIVEKNVPDFLKNKIIVSLNMSSVISGTKYRGEFEEKITKIIKEIENNQDYIIFIDEIHTLVGAGGAEGAIDASNILKPSLARGKIKCIGATTTAEYKKFIEKDKALDRRFQKILINEPGKEETTKILTDIKKDYEDYHNVKISNEIILKIVELSDKYIHDRHEPDRSIDILDEVCAKANVANSELNKNIYTLRLKELKKEKNNLIKNQEFKKAIKIKNSENKLKKLLKENIKEIDYKILISVIESKSNCKIEENENKTLKTIHTLKEKIIGENTQIEEFVECIKEGISSILISGPLGTGKSMLVKEFAKEENINLIKLDMNDFKNEMSISRLIGSPHGYVGYDDSNTIFETLKLNPSSIILCKNIEKANSNIINLLLNIMEEKELINSKNEKISFKNATFVFTTDSVKNNKIGFSNKTNKMNNNYFQDKVDYLISFNPLKEKDIIKIINKESKSFNTKLSKETIGNIIKEINIEKNGAKKIKSCIKKYLNFRIPQI